MYEPPEDADACALMTFTPSFDASLRRETDFFPLVPALGTAKSTFELGMEHLLTRMPRGQALDSINAFSQLRYAL